MFDNDLPDKADQVQVHRLGSMEPEWIAIVLKVGAINLERFTYDKQGIRLS